MKKQKNTHLLNKKTRTPNQLGTPTAGCLAEAVGLATEAYNEIFTLSYVTGRSVGIGAYLNRLGQRVIQSVDGPLVSWLGLGVLVFEDFLFGFWGKGRIFMFLMGCFSVYLRYVVFL